jgi:hypothetical protein
MMMAVLLFLADDVLIHTDLVLLLSDQPKQHIGNSLTTSGETKCGTYKQCALHLLLSNFSFSLPFALVFMMMVMHLHSRYQSNQQTNQSAVRLNRGTTALGQCGKGSPNCRQLQHKDFLSNLV